MGPFLYAYLVRQNFWLRGNISTGLAHELKSPLSSIQGALDIAVEHVRSPSGDRDKALEYLQMIQQNADRLEGFVGNLLHVAKTEEGITTIHKTKVDLSTLTRKTLEAARPQIDKKGLLVKLQLEDSVVINADEPKIEQVLSNLITNAIKYSDNGSLELLLNRNNRQVQFSISDEGRGIAKKNLERIFERFFQVNESSKGASIGLAIAKAWVEAHGGKIWAESEGEGKGTTVKFRLPI
jgi:signal transduction histidine kinase